MEHIFFYIISFVTLVSATGVVCFKKPINSALSLVVAMFGVAGLFALLNAHFLAVIQIAVYAGAVVVLMLFVIMLLNINYKGKNKRNIIFWSSVILFSTGVVLKVLPILTMGFASLSSKPSNMSPIDVVKEGYIEEFGRLLFIDNLFVFELSSVLILTALVGSVLIGKTKYD